MKSLRSAALLVTIFVCCVSCDQATKGVATTQLVGRPPISLLGDTIRLAYAENPGGFLSFGAGLPRSIRSWVFGSLALVVVLALVTVVMRNPSLDRLQLVAVSLLVAGGVGNLIDRVMYGVVRDFLTVGIGPFRTGVFNVADFAITVASVLLVMRLWKTPARSDRPTTRWSSPLALLLAGAAQRGVRHREKRFTAARFKPKQANDEHEAQRDP